jgi:hypothetical protein
MTVSYTTFVGRQPHGVWQLKSFVLLTYWSVRPYIFQNNTQIKLAFTLSRLHTYVTLKDALYFSVVALTAAWSSFAAFIHSFILNTIIWTYHHSSCMQYAFRSLLVMLPVINIMYCLWEAFGSGHHNCASLPCISALVRFMLYLWLYWFVCSALSVGNYVQLISV